MFVHFEDPTRMTNMHITYGSTTNATAKYSRQYIIYVLIIQSRILFPPSSPPPLGRSLISGEHARRTRIRANREPRHE